MRTTGMSGTICNVAPSELSDVDREEFIAMVRAGGEVGGGLVEINVRSAKCIVSARNANNCLVGVAVLKNPLPRYRESILQKTGVNFSLQEFPFELGYIFVMPSARKNGFAHRMCESALMSAGEQGVFATVRTLNDAMQDILRQFGFVEVGDPYFSERGEYKLQLFKRDRRVE